METFYVIMYIICNKNCKTNLINYTKILKKKKPICFLAYLRNKISEENKFQRSEYQCVTRQSNENNGINDNSEMCYTESLYSFFIQIKVLISGDNRQN